MNFILDAQSGVDLAFGGEVVLVGVGTVFAVLGIIWACLTVFKIVFYDAQHKKSADTVADVKAVVEEKAAVTASNNDDEIIAVIAAAIAAAESESSGLKFRVVSFRRK